jgi:hypothetical protein
MIRLTVPSGDRYMMHAADAPDCINRRIDLSAENR